MVQRIKKKVKKVATRLRRHVEDKTKKALCRHPEDKLEFIHLDEDEVTLKVCLKCGRTLSRTLVGNKGKYKDTVFEAGNKDVDDLLKMIHKRAPQ